MKRAGAWAIRRCAGLLAVALTFGASSARVEAQAEVTADAELPERTQRARALFESGREAYETGRFAEALDLFQRAYELAPRAELLFNIGQSHDRLAQRPEAVASYRAFLEARPDARNRAFVEARIRILGEEHERLSRVETEVEASPEASPETPAVTPAEVARRPSSARTGGLVSLAVAAASAVAAVSTGVVTLRRRADLEDRCPELRCTPAQEDDLDALRRGARATDALAGVAVVAATVGVVLVVVGRGQARSTTVGVGPTSLTLTHRF